MQHSARALAVEAFRKKRVEWLEWYGEDHHGIWRQFAVMFWNDTVFRTLNEARKLAAGKSRSCMNPIVARFIDDGYVANQTAAAKKLIEPSQRNAARQIISLRRLLDDARLNRALVTREAFVCQDEVPYDFKQAEIEFAQTNDVDLSWVGVPTSGPQAFGQSRRSHARFDALSGVSECARNPDDTLSEQYLDRLDQFVEQSGASELADYGNKFIAHAADPYSRSQAAIDGLNFNTVEKMHRGLYFAAFRFFVDVLEGAEYSPMPMPSYDQLEHMTEPWVDDQGLKALYGFWEERGEIMDAWRLDGA